MKKYDKKILAFVITVTAALFLFFSPWCFSAWDNDKPADTATFDNAMGEIRDNWDVLEIELGIDLNLAHPYYQSAAPSLKPDQSTALDVNDNGRMWIDSDDDALYVLTDFAVPTWTAISAISSVSTTNATFTLQSTVEEDTDFGRESKWISKGEQSGGDATTLGWIEFSHDGAGDDEKGQVRIMLNDGDDADAPTKTAIGFISTGKIDVSGSLAVLDEDDLTSDDDEVLATQQSIKAYVDAQNQSSQAVGTTDITNATGDWADMTNMSITLTTGGGNVLLMFSASLYHASEFVGNFRFDVDGTPHHFLVEAPASTADVGGVSMQWLETSLAAGSHTFKVQWKDATNTVGQRGSTDGPRVFTAIELP